MNYLATPASSLVLAEWEAYVETLVANPRSKQDDEEVAHFTTLLVDRLNEESSYGVWEDWYPMLEKLCEWDRGFTIPDTAFRTEWGLLSAEVSVFIHPDYSANSHKEWRRYLRNGIRHLEPKSEGKPRLTLKHVFMNILANRAKALTTDSEYWLKWGFMDFVNSNTRALKPILAYLEANEYLDNDDE